MDYDEKKDFLDTLEKIAIKSSNLILELNNGPVSSEMVHRIQNLIAPLSTIEQMTKRYEKIISNDVAELLRTSEKLRSIFNNIMNKRNNLYRDQINNICVMIENIQLQGAA